MNNKIYKIIFVLLIAYATLYFSFHKALIYFDYSDKLELHYEISLTCFLENHQGVSASEKTTTLLEKKCRPLINGLKNITLELLKDGNYIQKVPDDKNEGIYQILIKQLSKDVSDITNNNRDTFYKLHSKDNLSEEEEQKYRSILDIQNRSKDYLKQISTYLNIDSA